MKRKKSSNNTMLKQLRVRLGLSQEDLAKILDVSVFQVSRWENKKAEFSLNLRQIKKLIELLRAMGLDIESLPDDIDQDLPLPKPLAKSLDKIASFS